MRLARILASKLWGIRPEWKELKDFSALNAPQPRTGYLIIGDKVFDHEEKFRYRYDLADAWREMTGLPFAIACYGYGDRSYAYDYLTRNIDFVFDEQKRRATALYWQEGRKIDPPINPG